ncbi:MAG: hypothetical protein OXE84_03000 [Rhodobacteraceae bacterium]|nr:hypothetical protein [Paracoccaceae bacterium]MCY4326909.1 hypothetical protein [Paracoccaceae bacterium]
MAKTPGWDAQAISETARNAFGGFEEMFTYHHWPERGSHMMPHAGWRITELYGSVAAFVAHWKHKQASAG